MDAMSASTRPANNAFATDPGVWRGLSIGVIAQAQGFLYCLRLVPMDGSCATIVLTTYCEAEAVADWRYWTATLGLPRLVERDADEFDPMESRLGALLVRPRQTRRRGSPLFSRRPGRMSLRQIRKASPADMVYREEREIIARN